MVQDTRPHVALVGEGEQSACWATALDAQAHVSTFDDHLDGLDAVVVTPGAREPFARAREALEAGVDVLCVAPVALLPAQAVALQELSAETGVLFQIAEPFRHEPGFTLLRRLVAGQEPFWRPLYLRTVSLGPLGGSRLDEVAIEDLALCDALLDGGAVSVSATARHDETGAPCAAFMTVSYRDGVVVQCTVSPAEAIPRRELVLVTKDRTVVVDRLDASCSLRVIPNDPSESRAREACCTGAVPRDPIAEETARFLHAVTTGDRSGANVGRWAQAAAIWRAGCQSMSTGASVAPAVPTSRWGRETPPLRVIEGGVAGGRTNRPALTLVAS